MSSHNVLLPEKRGRARAGAGVQAGAGGQAGRAWRVVLTFHRLSSIARTVHYSRLDESNEMSLGASL